MVAALSDLILMLNEEHSGRHKRMTRLTVLCSLLIRVNGPVDVFMLNFACNGQTSVILFAHGTVVSIHCY